MRLLLTAIFGVAVASAGIRQMLSAPSPKGGLMLAPQHQAALSRAYDKESESHCHIVDGVNDCIKWYKPEKVEVKILRKDALNSYKGAVECLRALCRVLYVEDNVELYVLTTRATVLGCKGKSEKHLGYVVAPDKLTCFKDATVPVYEMSFHNGEYTSYLYTSVERERQARLNHGSLTNVAFYAWKAH